MNQNQYEKEIEAQKKRVQALQHLESNGCGPTRFESSLSTKGVTAAIAEKKTTKAFSTDNTLEQVRKQSASSGSLKTILLEQQVDYFPPPPWLITFFCRAYLLRERPHYLQIGKQWLTLQPGKHTIGIKRLMSPLGKDLVLTIRTPMMVIFHPDGSK
jgi:hypothetical protein